MLPIYINSFFVGDTIYRDIMSDFKLLISIFVLLSLVYFGTCDSVPQTSTFNNEKIELGAKPQSPLEAPKRSDATPSKISEASETSSASSPSSCGGLKGFLNLCHEKKEEDKSKQKRSLADNEKDINEDVVDPEGTGENRKMEKRKIPLIINPTSIIEAEDGLKKKKRQIETNEENIENETVTVTSTPSLVKRDEPVILKADPPENLTTDKFPPALLSSETFLPVPHKREEKQSAESKDYDDDDDDDDDDDAGADETDKR